MKFTTTQEDYACERDRLLGDLSAATAGASHPNRRIVGIDPLMPLESFCRVYACAVILSQKQRPDQGVYGGAHGFLADTYEQARAALSLTPEEAHGRLAMIATVVETVAEMAEAEMAVAEIARRAGTAGTEDSMVEDNDIFDQAVDSVAGALVDEFMREAEEEEAMLKATGGFPGWILDAAYSIVPDGGDGAVVGREVVVEGAEEDAWEKIRRLLDVSPVSEVRVRAIGDFT